MKDEGIIGLDKLGNYKALVWRITNQKEITMFISSTTLSWPAVRQNVKGKSKVSSSYRHEIIALE